MSREEFLRIENLHTSFKTGRGIVRAVDGVSLSLARGESLGIVGESGSGKTVLARSIMGLLPPRATTRTGKIFFNGEELTAMDSEHLRDYWGAQIAMVFQDPMTALNPVMKIGRQVTEHMIHHMKVEPDNAKQIALKLLTDVGIPEPAKRFDDYPHQMSGGMRQRIMIAIALACGPSLLLADEPTTALDVTVQAQILRLLAVQRAERNMSMILVTHDLGVVASNTDRVAVMYGGRIMETANTASLFANMRHPYTKALFDSIPNLKNPSHTELTVIPGRPPDLVNPPPGCKFAPRCDYATDQCRSEEPILETDGDSEHSFACWHPVGIRGKAGTSHA